MKTKRYMMILIVVALLSTVLVGVIGAAGLPKDSPATSNLPQRDPAQAQEAMRILGTTGLLLVPDFTNKRVMAFNSRFGNLVDPNFIPPDPANLVSPVNIILSPSGNSFLISDQSANVVFEYDLLGNFIGVFAPAGGANPAILGSPQGMSLRPNGNLLVTVLSGANAGAVAEFDTSGNFLGNFIEPGTGGLTGPTDIYQRSGDWLVSDLTSDKVLRFGLGTGDFIGNLASINKSPLQLAETPTGNVLVANFDGTQEGIIELSPAGSVIDIFNPGSISEYIGVHELLNGSFLVSSGDSVFLIARAGVFAEIITGIEARFIEFISFQPDLGNSSKDAPATAELDSQFTYTIVIDNDSDAAALNASLDDPIPAGLTYVPGSVTGGATFNAATNKIEWSGDIDPNSAVTITFAVDVTTVSGQVTNTATIDHPAITAVDVSATTTILAPPAIDLSNSSKTAPQAANSGSQFLYTIVVDNSSNIDADAITLTDPIPAGLTYVYGSATGGAVFNAAQNQIEWTGDVAGNSSKSVTFLVDVTAESGWVTNTASIFHVSTGFVDVSATTNIVAVAEGEYQLYMPVVLKSE